MEDKKLELQREKLEYFKRKMESKAETARLQAAANVEAAKVTARSTKMGYLMELYGNYPNLTPQNRALADSLAKELGLNFDG